MNLAFRNSSPPWEWLDMKENAFRRVRFGIAMEGAKLAQDPKSILEGDCQCLIDLPLAQHDDWYLQDSTGKH